MRPAPAHVDLVRTDAPELAGAGDRCARARTTSQGFVTSVAVSRGKIDVAITRQARHSPLTRVRKPPIRGTVSIDSLLTEAALPMVALPAP